MGSCMSKNTIVEEVNPPPHPEARRLWLVSTHIDPKDVPQDLIGIDADGLKAAMRNRGLETEHWALKADAPASLNAEPSIFDITLEGGTLVSHIHSTSSPYWTSVVRRVAIGWTIWKDQEIMEACRLLLQARPKYDGRANNSQQLARLLSRHIEFAPPSQQPAAAPASEKVARHATSPAASITKRDSLNHETGATPTNNRSQMALVSGAHSQRSHSIESDAHEMENKVSRVPPSIRHTQRMSVARPPLIHLSTTPAAAPSEVGSMVRPTLQRSAETDHGTASPAGSARMTLPPQQQRQQSPLNPSHRSHRQTASEIRVNVRTRTRSDAAPNYATMSAADRRLTMDGAGSVRMARPTRRRSEAPSEWLAELPSNTDARLSSTRSRSGPGRNAHRDSIISSGGSVMASPPMSAWTAGMGMSMSPSLAAMSGMPMPPFGTPPHMSPPMGPMAMWPPTTALQVPMPYFAAQQHPAAMSMPHFYPSMPVFAPASPGFHSHASSAVPTPPESPHLSTTHLTKSLVPDINLQQHAHPVRA